MPLPDIPASDWNAYQARLFQQASGAAITGLTTSYGPQIDAIRNRVAPANRVWVDRAVAAAQRYNVDPLIYAKQIMQESGFNPGAGSNEGAKGIAQFTDPTAKGFGINAWDGNQSLDAGARYMRQNLDTHGGDYRLALASYNAGGGNVAKYGQRIFDPGYLKSQGWSDQDANQPASYIKAILGDQTPQVAPVQAATPNPNAAWNQSQAASFKQALQGGGTSNWQTLTVPPTPDVAQPSFRDHAQAKIDALGGADATQYPADAGATAAGGVLPTASPAFGSSVVGASPSPTLSGSPGPTDSLGDQPPTDNANLKDFASYASTKIASLSAPAASTTPTAPLGYNDMAGASSSPAPAFGANPQDVTSPIDQARAAAVPPTAAPLSPLAATPNAAGLAYTGSLTPAKLPAYRGPAPTPYNDMAGAGGLPDQGPAGPDTPLGRLLAIPGQAQQAVSAAVMPDLSHPNETPQQRTQRYWSEHTDPNATPTDRIKQLLDYATSIEDKQVADAVTANPSAAWIAPAFKLATNPFTYLGNSPTMVKAGLAGAAIGGGLEAAKPSSSLSDIATQAIAGYGQGQTVGGLGEGAVGLAKAASPVVGKLAGAVAPDVKRLASDTSGMVGQPNTTRFFHGTGSSFGVPDATKFDPNGLFGPGYYLTNEPRVASSYAGGGLTAEEDKSATALGKLIARYKAEGNDANVKYLQNTLDNLLSGAQNSQVRAVNVPNDLKLLDADSLVTKDTIRSLYQAADQRGEGQAFRQNLAAVVGARPNRIDFGDIRTAVRDTFGPDAINPFLVDAGYDGIKYNGGRRIPMTDAAGAPIEHTAVVIFPESMGKLTNAISGTRFGSPPAVGGAIVGGLAGSTQGNTPEERARNALLGAAAGGVGAHLLGSGQLGRLAREDSGALNLGGIQSAGKSTAKAINELTAPAKNTPPQVQAALKDFANRNLEGAVQAETIGLRAKKILGPLDNSDTAGFFESTSQIHPSQTLDQAAFAQEVHDYMETTKQTGLAHGYIQGDVVNGPNAQVSSYFPHIYQENLTKATAQARRGGLNPNDFYSNSRTFPTLSDAQAAGFNPVDSFSGPLQHYVGRVASSEAKYQLVESLKNAGPPAAIPYTAGMKLPNGWVAGSSTVPQFAKYAFPESVAKAINNIVGGSGMRDYAITRLGLNAQAVGKSILFSLSGFHNVTELRQAINANGIKGVPILGTTIKHGLSGAAWDNFRLTEADGLAQAARSGVTGLAGDTKALDVGSSGLSPGATMALHSATGAVSGAATGYSTASLAGKDDRTKLEYTLAGALGGAAVGPLMKPIANSLWERQVPTLKYLTWKTQVAAGRDPEAAAKFVNNTYGGQNLAAIARSKTVQDVARTLLLAPDWWESWARQIKNVAAKGDTGVMARQYWARTAIINAFTLEGLNYAFNHHFTSQNDPDHANQLEVTGLYKQMGVDRRDPKTGAPIREYMSVIPAPIESLMNLATGGLPSLGKFAMGRASTPVRAGIQFFTNSNYAGRPIVPQYTPPLEAAKLEAANALGQISPIGVQQLETSGATSEPAGLAALATATGLRTSQASKSTYAGPQLSQSAYDTLSNNGLQWTPSPVGDSVRGIGLTRDERTRYQTTVDDGTERIIRTLGQTPSWQKLPPLQKQKALDDLVSKYRSYAADQVFAGIPAEEMKARFKAAFRTQAAVATR